MRYEYSTPKKCVNLFSRKKHKKVIFHKHISWKTTSVLTLYNYDDDPDNIDVYETLVKGINLMAKLPSIACYAYQSKVHYYNRDSLFIHYANPNYSIAENFLSLLRKDQKFSDKEARLLDTILILHADHGGGNNSTFTNVVIASTGTDIYSTVSGSIVV